MTDVTFARKGKLADQYGNQHQLGAELARGGQGVVYRTGDADLAIKQPLGADGEPDRSAEPPAAVPECSLPAAASTHPCLTPARGPQRPRARLCDEAAQRHVPLQRLRAER